jgi:hypothetical protein
VVEVILAGWDLARVTSEEIRAVVKDYRETGCNEPGESSQDFEVQAGNIFASNRAQG